MGFGILTKTRFLAMIHSRDGSYRLLLEFIIGNSARLGEEVCMVVGKVFFSTALVVLVAFSMAACDPPRPAMADGGGCPPAQSERVLGRWAVRSGCPSRIPRSLRPHGALPRWRAMPAFLQSPASGADLVPPSGGAAPALRGRVQLPRWRLSVWMPD